LREWKEVQKMLRSVARASGLHDGVLAGVWSSDKNAGLEAAMPARGRRYVLVLVMACAAASGAIFPDQLGTFTKSAPKSLTLPDAPLYSEYGLEATEQADFTSADDKHFTATAWRFHDSTGALAMFQLRRPSGAISSKSPELSARTSDGQLYAFGNYLFQVTGMAPVDVVDLILNAAPKLERAALPALIGFLPPENLVPNSERYVVGPVSLQRFEPRIAPSVAAFHMGSEAQLGKYRTPKGDMTLAIFNYPTPNIARERYDEFQKIPGAVAKRTGPLVAVVISPPDADAAERLLGLVRYEANLTINERVPKDEVKGFASTLLNIFYLAGLLIGLSVVVGIGLGGFKILLHRMGLREDPGTMTVLRLGDKTGPR